MSTCQQWYDKCSAVKFFVFVAFISSGINSLLIHSSSLCIEDIWAADHVWNCVRTYSWLQHVCLHVWWCDIEAYLIRDGQQSFVQLLHKLFECRSLGGNSMPAFTHHHVAAETQKQKTNDLTNIWYKLSSQVIRNCTKISSFTHPTLPPSLNKLGLVTFVISC